MAPSSRKSFKRRHTMLSRQQQQQQQQQRSLCTVFVHLWIAADLMIGVCYSYQTSPFLHVQRTRQQQRYQQQQPHCRPACLFARRPAVVEEEYYEYDDQDDDQDDDYDWPEPKQQEKQSRAASSPPQERPIGVADPDKIASRAKKIESNPNMDFRTSSTRDVPIQRYNQKRDQYYDDEEEDDYDDDDYYEDDDDETGNFWSNPPGRYDPVQSAQPRRRVPRPNEPAPTRRRPRPANNGRPSRGRKRSTFRSGTTPPIPVVGDFYNQLFWYGFDPAETTSPADKTMFGGTKGKFNGLAFLDNSLDPKPMQRSPRRRDNYYDDDDDEDGDDDGYGEEGTFTDTLERLSGKGRPGRTRASKVDDDKDVDNDNDDIYADRPWSKSDDIGNRPKRRKRRSRQSPWEEEEDPGRGYNDRRYSDDDDSMSQNWASQKVSNWFLDDSDNDEIDIRRDADTGRQRRQGRRSQSQQASWISPFDAVGNFFGKGKQDMSYEAEMYNRQMGLGSQSNNGERNGRSRHPERRKGYAYRYDVDTSEYDNVVDADIVTDDDTTPTKKPTMDVQDIKVEANKEVDETSSSKTTSKSTATEERKQPQNKERSWGERAMAMERIPPPDIPAWGPSGDLGMDARMKATIDAMQDIQEAQYKLEQKKKREQEATDDITILKVDVGVKRRRMAASKQEARMLREDIRNLELDVEDASRSLRKARDQVQFAKDRLAELEDRHWAVMGLYNPAQAEEGVAEALREFEASEPAVRLRVNDATENGNGGDNPKSDR